MTPYTKESIRLPEFARRDMETSQVLADHRTPSFFNMGFHAQQCAGKALNTDLTIHGQAIPRKNNLEKLGHVVAELGVPPFNRYETMKRTDLEKNLGLKINGRMKGAGTPERFGKGSGQPGADNAQPVNKLLGGLLKKAPPAGK